MVNIEVSNYVKAKLEVIKEMEGHKSHDSVIRVLLLERGWMGVPKETKMGDKKEIVIDWFLKHSCEEFSIYDRDADELLRNLEQAKEQKKDE